MPFVANDGVRLHYEVAGEGYPLVLHTGAAGDRRMWTSAGYVSALAGYQCILVDHRGHRLSDRPSDLHAHQIDLYVRDVVTILDDLHLPHAAFWGYSDGARVGYALAAGHPARITALVASGAIGPPEESLSSRRDAAATWRERGMAGLIADLEADEDIVLPPWLAEQFLETDVEMFALELEAWGDWVGPWPLFSRITTPTLILVGEREDPDRDCHRAVQRMPRARAHVLPGLGHVGAFLESGTAARYANEFLAEIRGARP